MTTVIDLLKIETWSKKLKIRVQELIFPKAKPHGLFNIEHIKYEYYWLKILD